MKIVVSNYLEKIDGIVQQLRAHLGVVSHHLQSNYSNNALGLYVVLSGFYASDGIWQHQNFDTEHYRACPSGYELIGNRGLKVSSILNDVYG